MKSNNLSILLIEDNPGDSRLVMETLSGCESPHFVVECMDKLSTGLKRLKQGHIDVILLDLELPDSSGIETFQKVQAQAADIPIIVLTELEDDRLAVESVHSGAQDYLFKNHTQPDYMVRAIMYAIEQKNIEKELGEARDQLENKVAERTKELERQNRELQENIVERKRAEAELIAHRDHLEERIKERTAELTKANAELVAENKERRRAESALKKSEENLRSSLAEKEVLLKEIHLRINNNLQVISSLLNLQSRRISDADSIEIFKECGSRINSISLVHEKLYGSADFTHIDFGDYTRVLTRQLFDLYADKLPNVTLSMDVETVFLQVNKAIPCALILNELVMNSLKFGFPSGEKGEIKIELHSPEKGSVSLRIGDNGVGLPDDFDIEAPGTLGMQIINVLVRQLHGTVEVGREKGAKFVVTFEVNSYRERENE